MKIFKNSRFAVTILVAIFAISLSNCAVRVGTNTNRASYKAKRIPPGQAKKIYGGKSAKRYAPGHNK
jgi:hypothetical protein